MDIAIDSGWPEFSIAEWEPIAKQLASLKKDRPDKIASLLSSFAKGTRFVLATPEERDLFLPPLFIDMDVPARTGAAMYEWHGVTDALVLSGLHVQCQSWEMFGELQTVKHYSREISFMGYPMDRFLLYGVEEADHAQFHRSWQDNTWNVPHGFGRVETYDTEPAELSGLKEQLRAAQHFGFPHETIEVLQRRLARAMEIITSIEESTPKSPPVPPSA